MLPANAGVPFVFVAAMLAGIAGAVQASAPVRTVESVDLDRYIGEWLEIARFPNSFQQSCAGDARPPTRSAPTAASTS